MRNFFAFMAVTVMAATVSASQARRDALAATPALPATYPVGVDTITAVTPADDPVEVFFNPGKMFGFGDLMTADYANKTGAVFRSAGNSKFGAYLDHKSTLMNALSASTGQPESIPIDLLYGMKGDSFSWGAGLHYSNAEDKVGLKKSSSLGIGAGAVADAWEAYVNLGFIGKSELNTPTGTTATANLMIRVGGQYNLGSGSIYADFQSGGGKTTALATSTDTNITNSLLTIGFEDKLKGEGSHLFYGVKYEMYSVKVGDQGSGTASRLPVYFGLEADVASWLVARASFAQPVLIDSSKEVAPTGTTITDTTSMTQPALGLGIGIKFGKFVLDGTLAARGNGVTKGGDLNAGDFMNELSATYTF
ncbi:MAG: hypothetical protein C5B49_12145 [Bdellovibrio sp.]|nr:MAG: hypothetical protein C5B49_12145 [Bdellovibrio sp.]